MAYAEMRENAQICKHCGNQFLGRKRKYCAEPCADGARFRRRRERRLLISVKSQSQVGKPRRWPDGIPACHKKHECKKCGKPFKPKRAGRASYCSQSCAFQDCKAWQAKPIRVERVEKSKSCRVFFLYCQQCEALYSSVTSGSKYCSSACGTEFHLERRKQENKKKVEALPKRICGECGSGFQPRSLRDSKYCSAKCLRKTHKRIGKAVRRARERTNVVELVNVFTVFTRDKWTCQQCRVRTPRSLRGSYDPKAPELDHIIPLSRGGEHSYRNVQCLCRSCNGSKGSKPMGQLRLFG
jgi:5-methylcytosine-specific restriction endonuclease McrA